MATKVTVQGRDIPVRGRSKNEPPNWATMYKTLWTEFCEALPIGITFKNMIDMTSGKCQIAGRRLKVTQVNDINYDILTTDHLIDAFCLNDDRTLTLPANPSDGDSYILHLVSSGGSLFNIVGNGKNIEGVPAMNNVDSGIKWLFYSDLQGEWRLLIST